MNFYGVKVLLPFNQVIGINLCIFEQNLLSLTLISWKKCCKKFENLSPYGFTKLKSHQELTGKPMRSTWFLGAVGKTRVEPSGTRISK